MPTDATPQILKQIHYHSDRKLDNYGSSFNSNKNVLVSKSNDAISSSTPTQSPFITKLTQPLEQCKQQQKQQPQTQEYKSLIRNLKPLPGSRRVADLAAFFARVHVNGAFTPGRDTFKTTLINPIHAENPPSPELYRKIKLHKKNYNRTKMNKTKRERVE